LVTDCIFMDTSSFEALMFADNLNHKRAASQYERHIDTHTLMYTSNYVLLEVARWTDRTGATVYPSVLKAINGLVTILFIDEDYHGEANKLLTSHPELNFSLTQCTTVLLARTLRAKVFGFEKKMVQFGILLIPG